MFIGYRYEIEVTELDNNNLTYIVSVKRQLQPYDNIRRYKLNFIIPGRHYSVRVRARVSLLNGTWSQPHSQLDRNYKDFVTRNVLTYMGKCSCFAWPINEVDCDQVGVPTATYNKKLVYNSC